MSRPTLLAGTADGLHAIGVQRGTCFDGRSVTALVRGTTSSWVILDRAEIWRESGGQWGRVAAANGLEAHCLLPVSRSAWVGTSKAHLLLIRRGVLEPLPGFERAPGRNQWFTPWGGPPDTRSLAGGRDGSVFANVHVGGILRTRDRGVTWQPVVDIDADVHQVVVHPTRVEVVLAPSAVGLGISRDGGNTWNFERRGFHALYQRAAAVAGDVVLVSTSRSERGQEAAVYRRGLDDDGPFVKCTHGLPQWFDNNVNTCCLAASGNLVAIGTVGGLVFVSGDRGDTWELAREGLPKISCLAWGG